MESANRFTGWDSKSSGRTLISFERMMPSSECLPHSRPRWTHLAWTDVLAERAEVWADNIGDTVPAMVGGIFDMRGVKLLSTDDETVSHPSLAYTRYDRYTLKAYTAPHALQHHTHGQVGSRRHQMDALTGPATFPNVLPIVKGETDKPYRGTDMASRNQR